MGEPLRPPTRPPLLRKLCQNLAEVPEDHQRLLWRMITSQHWHEILRRHVKPDKRVHEVPCIGKGIEGGHDPVKFVDGPLIHRREIARPERSVHFPEERHKGVVVQVGAMHDEACGILQQGVDQTGAIIDRSGGYGEV